jgi:flagellar basal body P-ring formation chaperone FlgA
MTGLLAWAVAACLPVAPGAKHITAGDLARADANFAAAPAGAVVAFAPSPGSQRFFRAAELRRLALRLRLLPGAEQDLCFSRRMSVLTPGRLLEAMQAALPAGRVELVDFSRQAAPEGDLVFSAKALQRGSAETFWNGFVRYGGDRRFPIWTKVRVETPPPPVARGEKVMVDVWSGAIHLEVEALAESSGAEGERVALRNLESKKRFFARVSGTARVAVGNPMP